MASILVVEDDESVARLLALTLRIEGHDPAVVFDGAAACDRLDAPPVDLVILDLMLPEVDGFQVLEALRAHPAWAATRVLLLTALSSDDDVWRGWSRGADYYLTKPFDLQQLRQVVERLLAGEDLSAGAAGRLDVV